MPTPRRDRFRPPRARGTGASTLPNAPARSQAELTPKRLQNGATPPSAPRSTLQVPLGRALLQIEKGAISGTLARVGGNQHMAAPLLGIGVKTLYGRLAAYRLPQDQFDLFFCPQAFSSVKTTRISLPHLLYLVIMTFYVCLSASDTQPPVAPTARGVWE